MPLEKLLRPSSQYPPVSRPPVRSSTSGPSRPVVLPNYVLPLFAAILVLVAVIVLPKILRRSTETPPSTATTATSTSTPAPAPPPTTSAPNDRATSSPSAAKPPTKQPAPSKAVSANTGNSEPKSTPLATTAPPATSPEFKTSRSELGRGEPLDQVLPEAPAKALSTIQGTVRIVVKANVDASGRVSEAVLDTPGPSRYFAGKALEAVQKWVFSSPVVDGHSVPSEWLIRFEFTPDGVKAYPSQTQP